MMWKDKLGNSLPVQSLSAQLCRINAKFQKDRGKDEGDEHDYHDCSIWNGGGWAQ